MASSSTTEKEIGDQLIEAGNKLLSPSSSSDELLSQLDSLELILSKVDQAPPKSLQDALLPSMKALIANELLRHTDTDVKISVTSCVNEITRITAPDAPYNDEQMKECFQLAVTAFGKLSHESSRSYAKAVSILDIVAKVRSCLMMLDLECDALVIEMFQLFLNTIRSNHPHTVFENMEMIMTMIIKESEDISWELLSTLLDSVKKENQNVLPMSFKLGEKLMNNCAAKLGSYLMKAVESMGIDLNDYSPTVSSICKTLSDDLEQNQVSACEEQMVASELAPDFICPEEAGTGFDGNRDTAQTKDNEASAEKNHLKSLGRCCQNMQSESTDARGNDESDNLETVKSEIEPETAVKKRGRKPNSLMNPEEGYDHSWISRARQEPKLPRRQKKHDKVKIIGDSPSENPVSKEAVFPSPDEKHAASQFVSSEMSLTEPIGASSTPNRSLPDGGSPDGSRSKRGKRQKKGSMTHQDAKKNSSVPEERLFDASVEDEPIGASSTPNRSVPDGGCPKKGETQKKGSMTQQDADKDSPSVLKGLLFSTSIEDKVPEPPRGKHSESLVFSPEISKSGTTSPTPNRNLPDGSRSKRGKRQKKGSMTHQDAEKNAPSVPKEQLFDALVEDEPIGASSTPNRSLPDGGCPDGSRSKRGKRQKKGSMTHQDAEKNSSVPEERLFDASVEDEPIGASSTPNRSVPDGSCPKKGETQKKGSVTQQDADKDSPSVLKGPLFSTSIEDKAPEAPRGKHADSQVFSPEISKSGTISPTPNHNLPDGSHSKRGKRQKKGSMTQQDANKNFPSVSKEHLFDAPVEDEAPKAPDVSVKEEVEGSINTVTKKRRQSNKTAVAAKTIGGTTPAPGDAVVKEEGQSDFEERPMFQSIMSVSAKGINDKGSSIQRTVGEKRRGRPKRAVTEESGEKKMAGSGTKSLNESNLDITAEKEIKRKRTPGKEEGSKTPHSVKYLDERLLGSRIKVWWPKDKTFYDGVVFSFDHIKKKHKVLYADGDEEVLNLRKQRWELIGDEVLPDEGKKVDAPSDEGSFDTREKREKQKLEAPIENSKSKTSTMKENSSSSSKRVEPSTDKHADDCAMDNPVILDNSESQNTGEKPESNAPETGGLERLSELADAQARLKKNGRKRNRGMPVF